MQFAKLCRMKHWHKVDRHHVSWFLSREDFESDINVFNVDNVDSDHGDLMKSTLSVRLRCWDTKMTRLAASSFCQYAAILLIGSPSVPRLVNLFKSMLLVWRVQSRPRPCAIGATFVTLSHPNCLNMPKGLVNIALGTHRYSQRALAKPNLILKYTNIFLIVQKCVVLHYIANANCGICCIWRPVIISKLVILCGYVRCPPLAWACPLSALTMDWRACEQREIHAKLDGKMWLFILEMSY